MKVGEEGESCEAEGGRGRGSGGLSRCKMHCREAQMDQWAVVCCDANCVLWHIYIYIYTKTKTHANKKHKVHTHTPKSAFIMQHLAFSALNLIILQTVHTNIQYI